MKIMIPAFISLSIACCVAILSSSCNSKEQEKPVKRTPKVVNIEKKYDDGWYTAGVDTTDSIITLKISTVNQRGNTYFDSVKLKEIQRSEYLSLGSEGFLLIRDDTVFFFNRKTETPTAKIPKSFFCKSFSY